MAKKKVTFKTPRGVFVYPYLTRPDSYKGKERYKCDIRLPINDKGAKALVKLIQGALKHRKEVDTVLAGEEVAYKTEYLPFEMDQGSGTILFQARLNRVGNQGKADQFTQKPFVYDGKGNLLPETVQIWTGSEGILNLEVYSWSIEGGKIGVSLRLRAAQVLKLSDREDRAAEDWGFEAQEDGDAYDATAVVPVLEGEGAVNTEKAEDY